MSEVNVFETLGGAGTKIREVEAGVQDAVGRLEEAQSVNTGQNLLDVLNKAESDLAEATSREGVTVEEAQSIQETILGASLASMRESYGQEEKDLQTAIYGMMGILNQLGEGYANLGKESPEDLALVEKAKQAVQSAKAEVSRLNSDLDDANGKTNFLYIRSRAIARVNTSLVIAQRALQNAEVEVPEAEAQAKKNARVRLQNANVQESLDKYTSKSEEVLDILGESRKRAVEMREIVAARKDVAFQARESATRLLEEWDEKLIDLETRVQEEESKLGNMVSGSEEFVVQETAITSVGFFLYFIQIQC